MNPVRSLAPDLVRGDPSATWVYIAGPLLGALGTDDTRIRRLTNATIRLTARGCR